MPNPQDRQGFSRDKDLERMRGAHRPADADLPSGAGFVLCLRFCEERARQHLGKGAEGAQEVGRRTAWVL